MKYDVKVIDSNVHEFGFDKFPASTLQCSDIHLDSIYCKREVLRKHFDEIKKADGLIFIYGDLLDAMASYGDKRLKREYVLPELIKPGISYVDALVDYTVDFLRPYAKNIAIITRGNHEQTIRKFHDSDILKRIVYRLNIEEKTNIQLGEYSGWIILKHSKKPKYSKFKIHYHHGFGGNAKRSKGMLDVQLEAMKYPDANMLVRGHTHQKWYDPSTTRVRITSKGGVYKDKVKYIQSGSYIDGIAKGKGGWSVQKNFMPTDLGGWFVDLYLSRQNINDVDVRYIASRVVETDVDVF